MEDEREAGTKPTGGRIAAMFGFVTAEDRQRWDSARHTNQGAKSGMRKSMKGMMGSLTSLAGRRLDSQVRAQDMVEARERFDETHTKVVKQRWDSARGRMVQETDWQDPHEQQTQKDREDSDLSFR